MNSRRVFILILLCVIFFPLFSQDDSLQFFKDSRTVNNTGMYVLGSWAVLNISAGAYGWSTQTGESKYFHQMNVFWNVVNISIASYALIDSYTTDYQTLSQNELWDKHLNTKRLYLINAGLDVIYIGAGLGLRHFANKNDQRANLLRGYGNSIILQGGFLLAFDAVMYAIQHTRDIKFLEKTSFDMSLGINRVEFYYVF